jgi:hypothetical protein
MRRLSILVLIAIPLAAQWSGYRDPQVPRKNGVSDLKAPAPHINGKPDLSGMWQAERTPREELLKTLGPGFLDLQIDVNDVGKYYMDIFWGTKPEEEPLRPEAAALVKARANAPVPTARCLPAGLPGALFIYGFKLIQTPRELVMLPESGDPPRQIYMDGRKLPVGRDVQPAWVGYSVAKWEGDTLVVETTGFNEDSWLDASGHPRSENMRIRESYHRRDFGHMDLEVKIEDPKYYTHPFGFKTQLELVPDGDSIEYVCGENEKDRVHTAKP